MLCVHKGSAIIGVTGFTITAILSGIIRSKIKKKEALQAVQPTTKVGTEQQLHIL